MDFTLLVAEIFSRPETEFTFTTSKVLKTFEVFSNIPHLTVK